MLGLIASTIITAFIDCLNPIALTQQFVLQGMIKKPKHIWYYIIAIGTTNLLGGLLAYFGLVNIISKFIKNLILSYGNTFYIIQLIIGLVFIIIFILLFKKNKLYELDLYFKESTRENLYINDELKLKTKIKSVTPLFLILLGISATASEIITALPYFAFLTILANYQLGFIKVAFILILYNFIYILPLIIMYFLYVKVKNKYTNVYVKMKYYITKWVGILVVLLVGIIGYILVYNSFVNLI